MRLDGLGLVSQDVQTPEVSVVVPLFNEADHVLPLYHALHHAMALSGRRWEVIFVDDGSTDSTYPVLRDLHAQEEAHVRVFRLRRNFGQTAAMSAGFDAARGHIIVSMDGDLQNDPSDIESLLKTLDDGYDVVSGWRVHRQEGFWLRRLPSRVANWLISHITGIHLHDYGCTLKAYRADVVKELRLYGEMHRFIPALIGGNGARIAELPVQHHARRHGRSKYGLSRTLRVIFDLMTVKFWLSFLTRPLQIFGLLGLATGGLGALICIYLAALRLVWHQSLAQRPLLMLGVLLLVVGVQFICMGILAEIQTRTYHESSNKPTYTIRDILDSTPD
ncbi:MAG: glycosyltransferase family 2 protein [Candidatus Tectomicrobia bacterium]|nr:glycosyltransferase family 2 protein [Candidatus Tectomicrobia bacterium]